MSTTITNSKELIKLFAENGIKLSTEEQRNVEEQANTLVASPKVHRIATCLGVWFSIAVGFQVLACLPKNFGMLHPILVGGIVSVVCVLSFVGLLSALEIDGGGTALNIADRIRAWRIARRVNELADQRFFEMLSSPDDSTATRIEVAGTGHARNHIKS